LASGQYYIGHTDTFAGKMLYTNFCKCNPGGAGTLYGLNSNDTVQTFTAPGTIYDYTIDGTTLYALGGNGTVYSTTDLNTWYLQASGITSGSSLAVLNGQIYVGTRDSKIYKAPVKTNPTQVTGSTTGSTGGTTTTKAHGSSGGGGGGHKK